MAKTKVARKGETSIPRLELCAALLLVRLVEHIRSVLNISSSVPSYLWSDSANTLDWIKRHPLRWMTYISNRVSEIQRTLPDAIWHHVPEVDNPADCASRGIAPSRLQDHRIWWQGPSWLAQSSETWPDHEENIDPVINRKERKIVLSTVIKHEPPWPLLAKYASLIKLLRVTALCLQFLTRVRKKCTNKPPCHLTATILDLALRRLIGYTQLENYAEEIRKVQTRLPLGNGSPLTKLLPFLDEDGLLRLGGRLSHAVLDYDERCPYILPKDSLLPPLVIRNGHQFMMHGGPQLTLSYLRRRYWILSGRSAVERVLNRCVTCARHRALPCTQVMAPLPPFRVKQTSRAFTETGLDYAGPIWIRTSKGRGHKAYKGYIVIFVCCAPRAVHLGVSSDCTSDAFITAFKRFSARRGVCRTLYSDSSNNFVGADRQLREMFTAASTEDSKIVRYLTDNQIQWKFNTPAAPHFGRLWEAAVRSVKHHVRRVLGDITLTFEEMTTFLSQVEACLNSRPIQSLKDDPNDLVALTPAHFLAGSPLHTVPESSLLSDQLSPLARWQLLPQMYQTFWKRWSTEYLHELQVRSKWQKQEPPIKVGDLVLILQENLPPTKWPLARVTEIYPGSDGQIRTVSPKSAAGQLKRPVVKLVKLPISVSDST